MPSGRAVLNKGSLARPREGAENCIGSSELFDDPRSQPVTCKVYSAVRRGRILIRRAPNPPGPVGIRGEPPPGGAEATKILDLATASERLKGVARPLDKNTRSGDR